MSEVENPVQKLWQGQPVEGVKMPLEEIRRRAGKFERRVFWRNVREYVSSGVAIGMFAYFFVGDHRILGRIAYVLFVSGILWVVVQLHRRGAVRNMPSSLGTAPSLTFFRTELERQRDLVANVWSWYLAPMVPGFVLLTAEIARHRPFPASLGGIAMMDGGVAVLFYAVWRLNLRAARCLQRTIDELEMSETSGE